MSVFENGATLFDLPAQPHVNSVEAPSIGLDILIFMQSPMTGLAQQLSPELPTRSLRNQTCVFIPAGLETVWRCDSGQANVLHLQMPHRLREEWLMDATPFADSPAANLCDRDLVNICRAMSGALKRDEPFRRLALQGLALAAIARLQNCLLRSSVSSVSKAMTPGRLRRVRAYVEDNLGQEVCLEDMAACVGLSPSHFSRAFRAETGLSPYAWVVQTRVERVKEYLLKTGKPLAEIAIDCGFSTQSHMTETFRRAAGLPPAQWRREQWGGKSDA